MGRISEYQRQSFRSEVQTSQIADAGIKAEAIGKVAEMGFDLAERNQKIQNETYRTQKAIELETKSHEIFSSWQKEFEADPVGKTDQLKSRLQSVRDEILNQAPSRSAQVDMGLVTDTYYSRLQQKAVDWESEQLRVNTTKTTNTALEQLQVKMLRNPHPTNFDMILAEGEEAMVPLGVAADKKTVDETRKKYQSGLAMYMFEGLVERDNLGGAKSLLNSQRYDSHLGPEGIQRVNALIDAKRKQNESVAEKIEKLKEKEPWEYFQTMGGKANSIMFNPEDDISGAGLRNSILKREEIVAGAKAKFGIDLPLLTPNETKSFIKMLNTAGTDDTLRFFSFYDKNITEDQKVNFARQVFEKEPSMGIALSISQDAPEDAQKIIAGQKLLRDNSNQGKLSAVYTPKAGDKDLDAAFDTYIGNATESAEFRKQIKSAAIAHYATSALRANKAISNFDEDLFKDSIAAVSAPVITVGEREVFSFRDKNNKFVDEDQIDDFLDELSDEHIEKIQGDVPRTTSGEPINIRKARGRLNFISSSAGKYLIEFNGGLAVDKNGDPFEFDMKKAYDTTPNYWKDKWKKNLKPIDMSLAPGTPSGKL